MFKYEITVNDMYIEHLGDNIVLNGRGKIFSFGDIEAKIWKKLENHAKISEIIEEFVREYDAEKEIIENDILKFFEQLEKEKLVRRIEEKGL